MNAEKEEEEDCFLLHFAFMDSSRDPPGSDAVEVDFVELSTQSKQIPKG